MTDSQMVALLAAILHAARHPGSSIAARPAMDEAQFVDTVTREALWLLTKAKFITGERS